MSRGKKVLAGLALAIAAVQLVLMALVHLAL